MKLVNNLFFPGTCREAFTHYAEVLGGEIKAMFPFGEATGDDPLSDQHPELIMHAWLEVGDQALMGCDSPPEYQTAMKGFSVALHVEDATEARRLFDVLVEGGTASMPFKETFWSPGFGMLTDRFGTPWLINTKGPDHGGHIGS